MLCPRCGLNMQIGEVELVGLLTNVPTSRSRDAMLQKRLHVFFISMGVVRRWSSMTSQLCFASRICPKDTDQFLIRIRHPHADHMLLPGGNGVNSSLWVDFYLS